MARVSPAEPAPDGRPRYRLELPRLEATLLASLPARLEHVLGDPGANRRVIERLFPASYADAKEELAHRRLLGGTLLDQRRAMLRDVRRLFVAAPTGRQGTTLLLGEVEIDVFLRFVNDLRLVLATELGIEKNLGETVVAPDDPAAPQYSLLVWLAGLESIVLAALAGESAD